VLRSHGLNYTVAKEKLIPSPPNADDDGTPRQKFSELASKVFSVPKSEIDKREKKWQQKRRKD